MSSIRSFLTSLTVEKRRGRNTFLPLGGQETDLQIMNPRPLPIISVMMLMGMERGKNVLF